ncbi:MAG: OmpH family outer membrane protein [Acidobacteriia bacterium]|nr:OmpH family outer membrane protein [Terriglobia bacterium]
MKIRTIAGMFFGMAGLLGASLLFAQASNASRVGVINMQTAILESIEGKKAADTLKTKYDAKTAELEKKKKEIEDLTAELKKQEKNLSEEAQTQKSKLIDTKQKELTRAGEDASNEFKQLQDEAINTIGTKIMRVIQSYASEQNYSLVIDSSSAQGGVLYFSPTTDITTEIIRRFDAQSASAAAPKPAAAPATPKK